MAEQIRDKIMLLPRTVTIDYSGYERFYWCESIPLIIGFLQIDHVPNAIDKHEPVTQTSAKFTQFYPGLSRMNLAAVHLTQRGLSEALKDMIDISTIQFVEKAKKRQQSEVYAWGQSVGRAGKLLFVWQLFVRSVFVILPLSSVRSLMPLFC